MKRGVSLSTLRRHIKAEKIEYRLVNGKYLVWCDDPSMMSAPAGATAGPAKIPHHSAGNGNGHALRDGREDPVKLQFKLERLEKDLKKAQEEIAELKMLIALYEERIPNKKLGN